MSKKRALLHHLTRDELAAAVNDYELPVADRRVKDQLVETLAGSETVTVEDLLAGYKRDRLKELCRAMDSAVVLTPISAEVHHTRRRAVGTHARSGASFGAAHISRAKGTPR